MALTVEDGTIIPGADSYVSVADFRAYAERRALNIPEAGAVGDATIEAKLLDAMDYLLGYDPRWRGARMDDAQPLAWPRDEVYLYGLDTMFSNTSIPAELKQAQMELAVAALAGPLQGTIDPTVSGPVTEKTVHGAVTVRYANSSNAHLSSRYFTKANALLRPLLIGGAGQVAVVRA